MSTQDKKASKRQRLKEARAAHILAAAARVFARNGYQKATTREIAAEAGVAEGTIYNYFKSKRELLFTMSSRLAMDSLREVEALPPMESEREYVTALVTSRFEVVLKNIDLVRALMPEVIVDDDFRQEYMDKVLAPAINYLAGYIRSRTKAGTFRTVEPEIIARAMIGAVMSFGLLWLQQGSELHKRSRQELVSELVGFFLDGLRVRPV